MPFPSAVRHLFRYLHDDKELRGNPIVARFFDDPSISGCGVAHNRAVLALIHKLVLEGANYCRDTDVRAGLKSPFRQHSIVLDHCLGRQDIKSTARRLGISHNLCYRERAKICRRVAMYILGWSKAPALQYRPHLDEFQLRWDSTVRAAINGDTMAAFRDCSDLIQAAGSIAQRIEAVCLDASTSLRFGNLKRAQHKLRDAKQLAENAPPDEQSSLWVLPLARIDSVAAELAHRTSQSARAVEFAESAADKLRLILENAPPAVGTAYVHFLSLRAAGLWNLGDVDRAYEAFVEVEARLSEADRTGWLGAEVMVPVWRARNRLVMSAKSWRPVWQRIEGLRDVFQNAYRLGALQPAVDALEGLTEVYAFSGNEAEALATGRLAVAIAEHQGSEWIRARTMLSVAQRLLRTSSTSYALSLIASVEALDMDTADSVAHSRLSSLVAERALRLQQYGTAWRLATAPGPRAEPMEIVLRKNVVAAVALHQLGRRSEALRQMEFLIPLAERLALAPVLLDAYHIASRIKPNSGFARRAAAIQDLLTA